MKHSAALPVAWITLRIMITLVWVFFTCIVALLAYSFLDEGGASKLFLLAGLPQSEQSMSEMRAIAGIGLLAAPINYAILRSVVAMVETVRSGDPFVRENAYRLNAIAWMLLVMEVGNIVLPALEKTMPIFQHTLYLSLTTSVNGWLVVILTFVLARVFAAGASMREDLEGTV
jgi:hypothetical protein